MVARQNYPSVKHLVCVAGPPCSGKTHALRALQQGKVDSFASMVPVKDLEGWPAFAPGWVPAGCPQELDQALFHYDFLRVWKFGGNGGQFDKDPVLDVFKDCERIDFVTLATDISSLRERFAERPMMKMIKKTRGRPRAMMNLIICFFRLRRLYRDSDLLGSLYDDWMEFTSGNARTHTIIDSSGSYQSVDPHNLGHVLAGEPFHAVKKDLMKKASERIPA